MPVTPAIMLQGTGSDVGKTVLVAGLCRLLSRRGLTVRPFKPQNMSNNAAPARIPGRDGEWGEIGRGQWLQAFAAGTPATVDMNPVLLKPESAGASQILVNGRVVGRAGGRDYQTLKRGFLDAVTSAFERLGTDADLVVVEGAGSPAEINLRANDIANMGFATAAGVPVVLVGDVDRGGVIASLVGTHTILPDDDRSMIRGYLINRFRGDVSLFDDGLAAITRMTGWPSLGVVPHIPAVARLPAEDSVALDRLVQPERFDPGSMPTGAPAVVAVLVLDRIANFDDLDPLKAEPGVALRFLKPGDRIGPDVACVLVPGSKATRADLARLRDNGWDRDLAAHVGRGGRILGLCGGYQMLGRAIVDTDGLEGEPGRVAGLGLLDVETVMASEKQVREVRACDAHGRPLDAYEIHIGRTDGPDRSRPLAWIEGRAEGARSPDGRVAGTYLHGIFANDAWRAAWLAELGVRSEAASYRETLLQALDALADTLETVLDVDALLAIARSRR